MKDNKKDTTSNDDKENKDLSKALAFLLSNDTKDISLSAKRDFLLTKLPQSEVDKAIELLPTITNLVNSNRDKVNQYNSLFSSFFDIGIITSSVLSSLIINYILDINRDKKNEFFAQTITNKINEECNNKLNELKNEINETMKNYVDKKNLGNEINNHLDVFSKGKGLTINPSLSKVKKDISEMQETILNLNSKIDNNNIQLTQNIKNDLKSILNEYFNNQK